MMRGERVDDAPQRNSGERAPKDGFAVANALVAAPQPQFPEKKFVIAGARSPARGARALPGRLRSPDRNKR